MQLLAALLVVALPALARADMVPPPTGLIDVGHLGSVGGPIAFFVIYGAGWWLYARQRRTGRTRLRAFAWAALLIVVGNLVAYFFAMTVLFPRDRQRRYEERMRERSATDAAHPVGVVR